ncbi:MAG: phage tail protein [Clostridiales bacterium]|nr:phage tail protein [Clostridiales bacterium]
MYTMYADGQLLYSPDFVDENLIVLSPYYEKEANENGSCQFDILKDNPYYSKLKELKTLITVKDDDEEVWRGRILNTSNDFDNRKTVYCEGTLSFFVDSIMRPYSYHSKTVVEMLQILISNHNSQVEDWKKFSIGTIDIEDLYGPRDWESEDYVKSKDLLNNILNDYGGYFMIGYNEKDGNTFSYVNSPGIYSSQSIEFGENLLDVTTEVNPENIFTVLIPISYDSEGNMITVAPVNDGKDYIESAYGIERYGKIYSYYVFEEDISDPNILLEKGRKYLEDCLKSARNITIQAIDIHALHPDIKRVDVYDLIKVHSEPHDIDEYEMCTKVKIDLEDITQSEYVIGTLPMDLADIVSKQDSAKKK